MPRYEYKDAKSSKFWTIERTADGYDVCYGKIGTSGRQQSKSFDTTEKADKEHAKVVAAKIKKGYVLVGEGSADAQEKDADVADVPDDDAADGRPKGVPAGAVMADNGYEWELAERNAKGKYHGVVTWWRLDGTRCCRTEYEDGDPKSFQRFHPNGQVSREGTFKNGRVSGVERFHRSSEKTGEHFAVYSAGRRVWTAEVDHAKGVRRFFDKKGEPCDQQGKKLPAAVQPDERADVPAHWKAAPKSGVKQDWTPTAFETELRDGVYFTNDLRQVIFPRQGGAETSVRPVPDVDTAWAALRNAMWACDAAILEHQQSENRTARSLIWRCMASNEAADRAWAERLVNSVHQEVPLEQDIEFAKRFYQRYRGVCIHGAYSVATYARIADYLIATRGLGEAAVCLMKGIESELPYQRMASFERVRDMLAVATPSDYAAAKLRIMEGFVEAVSAANQKSYVGRLPAHLAWARSFLLPLTRDSGADERESADLALKACVGRGFGNDELNAGGLASVDIAGLERFLETNPKVRHEFFTGGARIYLASILDSEGVAAASILANMKPAKPFEDSARENNRWAFLLAHLDSDEALGALHDEHKAGYAWGAEGLSLAMQFQPARVESLLKGRADTDLLAALPDTKPLGPPSLEQRDADEDGNPGVYEPATPKRAPERKALIEIPFTCEWTPEEEEEALSHNQPLTWNGEPLSPETMGEWVEHCERWSIPSAIASFALRTREYDTRLAALGYAFSEYEVRWGGGIAMLMAGEGARGLLAAMVEESLEGSLRWAQPFGDHRIAPPILVGFIGKKYKADCRAWILRHPRCAWAAAITMALANVGKKKPSKEEKTERSAGERVLRYLAGQGFREELLKDAKGIGEEAAVMALLDVDPLTLPKAKIPKLPAFADAASLPALERIAGGTLSAEEVEHILVRLAVSNVDEVHPAVLALRSTLTPESMKTFSWALFEAWLSNKAPSKQGWAMQALGFMGDDETARNICRLAKDWPGQNASARAQAALDVLLAIGSEVALVNMNLLAEKSKYPAFKAAAAERIGLIAQKRGLTRAALQDRLVPTLSLEEEGGAKLDFGPRHFVVSFDEQLRPVLHDDSGKKLKSLPKPNKADDSALAKAAKARFSGLKKDAKASASVQLSRLEFAMIEQRTIEGDVFEEHFVNHPWMSNLTKRLVWCAVDKKGDITASFRVGEDGSFADSNDDAYSLKAKGVRIAHPLQIQGDIDKWSSIFADYEILQPFDQLGRMTFAPSATEKKADTLERVVGKNVRYGALRALTKGRWRAWADSWITTYSMELIGGGSVSLGFEPGYSPAGDEFEDQTIESVNLSGVDSFAAVEPIAFSELVRELEHIT